MSGSAGPVFRSGLIIPARGHRVLLDRDLARVYGVATKALLQAVKRNRDRFPEDFMFQLSWEETKSLVRSHVVTLPQEGHFRYRPFAFTEQGVAMLSSVLRSPRAIRANIEIMRAFVRLRQMLGVHADLARKLEELERKYDGQFRVVFEAIRELMQAPPEEPRERIGFHRGSGRP